jgi:hypothetical protein
MVSKKQTERAKPQAFRERLSAATADFTPPTLEEMLTIGDELFKNPGSRSKVRRRSAGVPRPGAKAGSKKIAKSAARQPHGTRMARTSRNAVSRMHPPLHGQGALQ